MTVKLTAYLVMDGNAQEAIHFYEKALDAQVLFTQSFGEMPANPDFPLPEDAKGRIGHAMLQVGESSLMFSDTFPGQTVQKGDNVTICITSKDKEKSQKFYNALKDGGQVIMELQETHFSPSYGQVKDKFGVTFQIFTEGASMN
ncbi:VOC family protein [Paenibacillus alginolyticus]|uniref:VOC family protein n=1 Tax=Paenibacillus alginolyticus TaxID=59839 RepID=A0ABT4GHL4_9BACL|nr:VOC family protein [Paenibacillus alginolyticus]MCY9695686.1 VOC family protein [Paenibacillus alginolyticus]MEC0142224.1 VOC family protein [Paenibacillus alginolyticus]